MPVNLAPQRLPDAATLQSHRQFLVCSRFQVELHSKCAEGICALGHGAADVAADAVAVDRGQDGLTQDALTRTICSPASRSVTQAELSTLASPAQLYIHTPACMPCELSREGRCKLEGFCCRPLCSSKDVKGPHLPPWSGRPEAAS